MAVEIKRKHFTVDEYYRMLEAGILTEDDRVELIDGEILEMSPIGSHHAGCVTRLNMLLNQLVGQHAVVAIQNPIHLNDRSEPQPDVALLKMRSDYYANDHPTPQDILLVIEVADTSVGYDKPFKIPRYARAGIEEVWLVDLPAATVEVYSNPVGNRYQRVSKLVQGDTLSIPGSSTARLSVETVLGLPGARA